MVTVTRGHSTIVDPPMQIQMLELFCRRDSSTRLQINLGDVHKLVAIYPQLNTLHLPGVLRFLSSREKLSVVTTLSSSPKLNHLNLAGEIEFTCVTLHATH